jgi:putative ABC transport system permease protein
MESLLKDLGQSLRARRRSPGFAATAIVTLARGIGANTAIFTVVNAVLLQPLPFPDSQRIVSIGRAGGGNVPEPVFLYWRENNPGLEDLAAFHAGAGMNLAGGDRPEVVAVVTTSRSYFPLFGAHPILGRTFTAGDDSPGAPRVLLLSYGLWQRRFGGNASVLGSTVTLGGAGYAVAGVLLPGFQAYPPAEVWIPLQAGVNRGNQASVLTVAARLPQGVTLAQAAARMAVLGKRYAETRSRAFGDPNIEVTLLQDQITGDVRPGLWILLGAVGLVLLIACANVANLLLARASARRSEIAVRAALGAGRGRIVRQLLTESAALALAGGLAGLLLGSWTVRGLLAFAPGDLPRLQEIAAVPALDARVAAFAFLLAGATGIVFGLLPALDLSRASLGAALNESGGRTGVSRRQTRTRSLLVGGEVALAVVLLSGAALLIRSFFALHHVHLGFERRNLLAVEVSLAGPGYAHSSAVDRLSQRIVDRLERIPGVECAAMASALPLQGRIDMIFNIPGRTPGAGRHFTGDVQWRIVSARYFEALRIPLLSGRLFRDQEPRGSVVISETMARRFFPGENPMGRTLVIGPELGPRYAVGAAEIIGVVGDVRERLDVDPQPVMYQMPQQIPDGDMALINAYERGAVLVRLRPGIAPASAGRASEETLLSSGSIPAAKVRTMDEVAIDSTARKNFHLLLLGSFSFAAVLLAAVGIYGVVSYTVEQRTRELGIRTALGATRSDNLLLVLRQSLGMTLAGVGGGTAAALWLTRLISSELFGVSPRDPATFLAVPLILLLAALAAAAVPALRASRLDPLAALRHE